MKQNDDPQPRPRPAGTGGTGKRKPIHRRDTCNERLLPGVQYTPLYEFPVLKGCDAHPLSLVPYSAACQRGFCDPGAFIHFFEDDYRFESIWRDFDRALGKLRRFAGIIEPDFSTCIDYPRPVKAANRFRSQLIAARCEQAGIKVIPSVRAEPGCPWLLDGVPRHSTIAISGYGLIKDPTERRMFLRDVKATVDTLQPRAIVYYGSDSHGAMDYPRSLGITVWTYPANTRYFTRFHRHATPRNPVNQTVPGHKAAHGPEGGEPWEADAAD